jgi:hypothetical protein
MTSTTAGDTLLVLGAQSSLIGGDVRFMGLTYLRTRRQSSPTRSNNTERSSTGEDLLCCASRMVVCNCLSLWCGPSVRPSSHITTDHLEYRRSVIWPRWRRTPVGPSSRARARRSTASAPTNASARPRQSPGQPRAPMRGRSRTPGRSQGRPRVLRPTPVDCECPVNRSVWPIASATAGSRAAAAWDSGRSRHARDPSVHRPQVLKQRARPLRR